MVLANRKAFGWGVDDSNSYIHYWDIDIILSLSTTKSKETLKFCRELKDLLWFDGAIMENVESYDILMDPTKISGAHVLINFKKYENQTKELQSVIETILYHLSNWDRDTIKALRTLYTNKYIEKEALDEYRTDESETT